MLTRTDLLMEGVRYTKAKRDMHKAVVAGGMDWDTQFVPFLKSIMPTQESVSAAAALDVDLPPIDWSAVIAAMQQLLENCDK